MRGINKNSFIGFFAGIITGITYGFNPLFGLPLMKAGASIEAILFFRYAISVVLLGVFIFLSNKSFRISWKQMGILLILGCLYTMSSIFLFEAYNYIASGLATTLIFLYPVFVALIMVVLRVYPSWQVWLAILATFAGVLLMTYSDDGQNISMVGVLLSLGSALVYALFIVIINRSKAVSTISNSSLTFYSLFVGCIIFMLKIIIGDSSIMTGIDGTTAWLNLLGLAILPTVVSTASLALATRKIGPTKASVLGVFEPITAILIGAIAFSEPITMNILVGIVISMVAITFMICSTKK